MCKLLHEHAGDREFSALRTTELSRLNHQLVIVDHEVAFMSFHDPEVLRVR